jgi:hypothetical protein
LEAVHQKQNQILGAYNMGPELADRFILLQNTYHNVKVAERQLGWHSLGHYQHHRLDKVQLLMENLFGAIYEYGWFPATRFWTRGCGTTGFQRVVPPQTAEQPVEPDVISRSDLQTLSKTDGMTRSLAWLGMKQMSRIPYLGVGTDAEKRGITRLIPQFTFGTRFKALELAIHWNQTQTSAKAGKFKKTVHAIEQYHEITLEKQRKVHAFSLESTRQSLYALDAGLKQASIDGLLDEDDVGRAIIDLWNHNTPPNQPTTPDVPPRSVQVVSQTQPSLQSVQSVIQNVSDACTQCKSYDPSLYAHVEGEVEWISCDNCDQWYHHVCVFGRVLKVPEAGKWYCQACCVLRPAPRDLGRPVGIVDGPLGVEHHPTVLSFSPPPAAEAWQIDWCAYCSKHSCPATKLTATDPDGVCKDRQIDSNLKTDEHGKELRRSRVCNVCSDKKCPAWKRTVNCPQVPARRGKGLKRKHNK